MEHTLCLCVCVYIYTDIFLHFYTHVPYSSTKLFSRVCSNLLFLLNYKSTCFSLSTDVSSMFVFTFHV